MTSARFQKSIPRKTTLYENIGPEISGRRLQVESRLACWHKQGAQIAKEDAWTRGQFDQQPRCGFGLQSLLDGPGGHLFIVDAKPIIRIAGRAEINAPWRSNAA